MSNYLREIKTAHIDATRLTVELIDDSTFTVPLTFYPTLLLASDEERSAMEIHPYSLHWKRSTATSASRACCKVPGNIRNSPRKHGRVSNNASTPRRDRVHAPPPWLQAVPPLTTKLSFPAQIRRCLVISLVARVKLPH